MSPKGLFRLMNRIHIFLYRTSKGRILGKVLGSPVLLLTTIGRKTGQPRTVPLVYAFDNQHYAVIASDNPAWYRNLKDKKQVSIEIWGEHWQIVEARDASEQEKDQLWSRFIQQSPAFDNLMAKGDHQLVILEPINI